MVGEDRRSRTSTRQPIGSVLVDTIQLSWGLKKDWSGGRGQKRKKSEVGCRRNGLSSRPFGQPFTFHAISSGHGRKSDFSLRQIYIRPCGARVPGSSSNSLQFFVCFFFSHFYIPATGSKPSSTPSGSPRGASIFLSFSGSHLEDAAGLVPVLLHHPRYRIPRRESIDFRAL